MIPILYSVMKGRASFTSQWESVKLSKLGKPQTQIKDDFNKIKLSREIVLRVYEKKYLIVRELDDFENNFLVQFQELEEYVFKKDARTLCILIVSFLEDTLKRSFIRFWEISGNADTNRYFGSNGPLSTFSQRALIAVGLNWLTAELAAEADALRKIRNAFAHNHRVRELSHTDLANQIERISRREEAWICEGMEDYAERFSALDNEARYRLRLFACSAHISAKILVRSKLVKNEMPADWSGHGYDGLMKIEQAILDIVIKHCFGTVGILDAWNFGEKFLRRDKN